MPGEENQFQQEVLSFSGVSQTFSASNKIVHFFFIFWKRQRPHLLNTGSNLGHGKGGNDPVLKRRVIPAKCHGWSGNSYGAAEFISPESITGEVATEILSLEAE